MTGTQRKTYKTRARILKLIYEYTAVNGGKSPTIRYMMARVGLKSTSTVDYHLQALIREKEIEFTGSGNWRRIIIPGARYENPPLPEWVRKHTAGPVLKVTDGDKEITLETVKGFLIDRGRWAGRKDIDET